MGHATFRHQQRITYADCTVGNHVYYARYLDLLEAARGEFFRSLGMPLGELQRQGIAFPVTECHLSYHHPVRYDALIVTELWLTSAKGARLRFAYRMLGDDQSLVLEGDTHHACVSLAERPRRIPEGLLVLLQPYAEAHTA